MYDYKWDEGHYDEVFDPKKKPNLGLISVLITSIIVLVVVLFITLGEYYGY